MKCSHAESAACVVTLIRSKQSHSVYASAVSIAPSWANIADQVVMYEWQSFAAISVAAVAFCRCGMQVIEARNIGLPSDILHTFFTLDAYAVVTVNTEAGPTSRHTRVVRNNLMPIWNEKIAFEDVALSNMLTLAIFDHKKLTADVHLGQVSRNTGCSAATTLADDC